MVGLVLAIVGILIIAGVIFALLVENNNYTPKVGDFLKYRITSHQSNATANYTIVILGVNSTHLYYSLNIAPSQYPNGWNYSIFSNDTKNDTWFLFDVTDPPIVPVNWTHIGTDTIQFDWGARSADKYSVTYANTNFSATLWVRNGVVVKYENVESGIATWNTTLIDSNIPQVID
jgi:hypothetical protein